MPTFKSIPKTTTGRNASKSAEQIPQRQKPARGGKFKRFLMLLLLVIIVMLASIGITVYLTWPASADLIGINVAKEKSVEKPIDKEIKAAPLASEKPLFLTLEPFTATITDGSRSRVIYVGITPQLSDEVSVQLLKKYEPMVRDRILRILSEQNPIHVQTPEGRQQLVDSLIHSLSDPYGNSASSSPRIQDLLFTAFVIQ